jgi:GMP synthase (glutamine-hydrolysing)
MVIKQQELVLILDFGSQYTQLIARRVRELGVYCVIYPYDLAANKIKELAPHGIILSGGPQSVASKKSPRAPAIVFQLGCPVLGICYGMQTMAAQLGGKVASSKRREFGSAEIQINKASKLLAHFNHCNVWMSHGDKVTTLPPGFKAAASSANTKFAAMEDVRRNFYALQFHPEVTHTKNGKIILQRFVLDICGCKKLWTTKNIIREQVKKIQNMVGKDQIILGLSGGVDSAVTALLLQKAIGRKLICVFVDTGLLRWQEGDQVMALFAQHFGVRVLRVNAEERFIKALQGVSDPEKKRKIIGTEFIAVFAAAAKKLKGIKWLAQGTIYPDVIESAQANSKTSAVIKSHHNVGGLPQRMDLKLVEPLRELFKDEVRKVGLALGLPHPMLYRHPFPGPGLAVRILGEVRREYVEILRQADHIFLEELEKQQLYYKVNQAFAVFLPVKSVGVMGDARKYEYVVALRAVETIDFMTARVATLPHQFLQHVANRISNEVHGVSRVVYDISSKPPATIEWE